MPCYYPPMAKNTFFSLLPAVLAACVLCACNPEYNWRDYSSQAAPYRVMFPGKPDSHTRSVDLDGLEVEMTMTATEVNGVMFAVGSAEVPDPARAQAALAAMKTAMVRNIGATITRESQAAAATGGSAPAQRAAIDIEASGSRNGTPTRLVGHFEARGTRVYQVIVVGQAASMPAEQVKQFMSSFKPV
jgi:hypothetical protein